MWVLSIWGTAPGVAPRILAFVLLKPRDAIPRMEFLTPRESLSEFRELGFPRPQTGPRIPPHFLEKRVLGVQKGVSVQESPFPLSSLAEKRGFFDLSGPNRAMQPRCAMRFESHIPKSLAMRKSFFFFASDAKIHSLDLKSQENARKNLRKYCDVGLRCEKSGCF